MSDPRATKASAGEVSSRQYEWSEVVPVEVAYEDAMSAKEVAKVWEDMLIRAKIRSPDERTRAAFRLGVYVYACINGTSREGSYTGMIKIATGQEFSSSVIPLATGKMKIRKFFRGNMDESYEALKSSGVIERDARMVTKAADLSIGASEAFAIADWFTDCPLLTPSERLAHQKSCDAALSRARRARGAKTLEEVEDKRVDKSLEVQGSLNAHEDRFAF